MDIKLIKQLRDLTSASLADCTSALEESKGDIKQAEEILKRKGKAIAAKKNSRETKAGVIYSYIHANGKVGVLLDLRCETDFVARNEFFTALAHDIALQIAAMAPTFVSPEDVSTEYIEKEKAAYIQQMKESGKPENILDKIAEGKVQKELAETCLLNQPFVKEPSKTIQQLIEETIGKLGENIKVIRFSRFEI